MACHPSLEAIKKFGLGRAVHGGPQSRGGRANWECRMANAKPGGIRLVHNTTVPQTLRFLHGQVQSMKSCGFDVLALSSPGDELDRFARIERIPTRSVAMTRRISPVRDLIALFKLWVLLAQIRPHIVHAHTPKAGLLGMLAALLARVPVRVYHIRGLPMATAQGPRRWLLTRRRGSPVPSHSGC